MKLCACWAKTMGFSLTLGISSVHMTSAMEHIRMRSSKRSMQPSHYACMFWKLAYGKHNRLATRILHIFNSNTSSARNSARIGHVMSKKLTLSHFFVKVCRRGRGGGGRDTLSSLRCCAQGSVGHACCTQGRPLTKMLFRSCMSRGKDDSPSKTGRERS